MRCTPIPGGFVCGPRTRRPTPPPAEPAPAAAAPAAKLLPAIPAQLERWLSCPRQYRHQHVDRPPPPRAPQTTPQRIGTAVHITLSRLLDGAGPPTPERAAALLGEEWPAEATAWRDPQQSAEWLAAAGLWVRQYALVLPVGLLVLGTERRVAAKIGRASCRERVSFLV